MYLDTSPQINPRDPNWRPESPDSLPELELQATNIEHYARSHNDSRDDLPEPKKPKLSLNGLTQLIRSGGVPVQPHTTSKPNLQNSSTAITTETDLSSPKSDQSTPRAYARYPLFTIPEELNPNMDLDDDIMPDLEDTSSPPFPKRSSSLSDAPKLSNHTNLYDEDTSDSSGGVSLYYPNPNASKEPNNGIMEIDDSPDDSSPTKSGGLQRPCVHIDWAIWAPDDLDEKYCYERVCQEVAIANGFQKVVIKSHMIEHDFRSTWDTKRYIYVEPYIIATFTSYRTSPTTNVLERETHTANIHLGPESADHWTKMGIWRKGGKEAVEWVVDEVVWRDTRRVEL